MAVVLWGSAAWLCLAGLLRNLHAFVVFPQLEASPEGLHLRYWKPSRIFTWNMFLPFNRVVDATIPWSDYRGCRTSIISGGDPWDGWQKTKALTAHFHIKDWVKGEQHGRLAGEGNGRIPEVLAEAVAMNYDGFATLEPHLLGGGPTGGVTGPELFPKAVAALKSLLDRAGAKYR